MTRPGRDLTAPRDPPPRDRALFSVLIADADHEFRRLVRRHLGRVINVVGDVGDGDEAVRLARQLHPDVVLMDMAMPVMGGPEAARRIKADHAETKVVLLTSGEDEPDGGRNADALLPKKSLRAGLLSRAGRPERRRTRR